MTGDRLADPVKAGGAAFLLTKEHGRVLARCIVHRDHQIPHRLVNPAVGAGILVDHHPRQRCPIALDAVLATRLVNFGRPRSLEHAFEPAVAARTFEFGLVFAVKMDQILACKTGFVQRNHLVHLGRAGSALGDLAQSPVQQPLQPVRFVTLDVTAKTALALAQQLSGLTLSQPAFIPANICLFETHLPVLLHVASPADRCVLHRTPQTGQPICS